MEINKRRPRIVYVDPQGIFSEFQQELTSRLPLHNLHWNPGDRPLRTIPVLDVEFVPLGHQEKIHQNRGLTDEPLVRMLILEADGIDEYRGKLRKIAKEWRNDDAHIREPTGWLVAHYIGKGKPHSKSVWHKLNTDFEGHVVQIDMDFDLKADLDEMWGKFFAVLKYHALDAFSRRVASYESEIQKLEAGRNNVGWNFGTLFCIKEGLASSFERMNFLEDALQTYAELEKTVDPSCFTKNASCDTTSAILEVDQHKVSDTILEYNVSKFDYYRYLYSRQIRILIYQAEAAESTSKSLAERHIVFALQKAREYIVRLLSLLGGNISVSEAIKWQYRAACEVYRAIEPFVASSEAGRGELLLIEREALQALGQLKGYRIPGILSDIPLTEVTDDSVQAENSVDSDMDKLVADEETYVKEYVRLTQEVFEKFQSTSNLPRTIGYLVYQMAAVYYYHYEDWAKTIQLLDVLPRKYAKAGWLEISAELHRMFIDCAQKLGKNDKVIELAWSALYLRPVLSPELNDQCIQFIEELGDLQPTEAPVSRWFDVEILPYLHADGRYYVEVNLKKKDSLGFLGFDKAELFAYPQNMHVPIDQTPIVFSTTDVSGETLKLSTSRFVEGTIVFKKFMLSHKKQVLVDSVNLEMEMVPFSTAFNASLQVGREFATTKRNVDLKISSPTPVDVKVRMNAVDGVQLLTERISDTPLKQITEAVISVPALVDYTKERIGIRVVIEYSDGGWYEFLDDVDLSLFISVQSDEKLRADKVITRFLVESAESMPVIVQNISLSDSRDFSVIEAGESKPGIVLQGSPVHHYFTLGKSADSSKPRDLALEVKHRTVRTECEAIMWSHIDLDTYGLQAYSILVKRALRDIPVDIVLFIFQDRFKVDPDEVKKHLAARLGSVQLDHKSKLLEVVPQALCSGFLGHETEFPELDTVFRVLVPPPEKSVVHFVSLNFEESDCYLVGQAIKCQLCIKPDFTWAGPKDNKDEFTYRVLDSDNGLAFSGILWGKFSKDEVRVDLFLTPYKAGLLETPEVEITCNNSRIRMEVVLRHAARKIMVVPSINRLVVTF
ncbi:hypothetical protein B9G98_00959 [Wickerhamiella sorbophila]|uniref:Uncharacterized protein n=1 Tax=Wickerhamiella sorbophila TaxID=45607 RepID=A0A2T0FEF8_9ASCO|nr:hypothetical protein B9G98_00959 [Wickerhamiella sorbophila]PRT53339.1 hypothetical protein B9G98_00959 [Wickerhamiella sorbophila]